MSRRNFRNRKGDRRKDPGRVSEERRDLRGCRTCDEKKAAAHLESNYNSRVIPWWRRICLPMMKMMVYWKRWKTGWPYWLAGNLTGINTYAYEITTSRVDTDRKHNLSTMPVLWSGGPWWWRATAMLFWFLCGAASIFFLHLLYRVNKATIHFSVKST